MDILSTIAVFSATANMVDARPQFSVLPLPPPKLDDSHIVDFEKACKKYQPPEDRCIIIPSGYVCDLELAPEELAIGNDTTDKMAVVSLKGCKDFFVKSWEPQSLGFKVNFNFRVLEIEAETGWIGIDAMDPPTIDVNGKEVDVECSDADSRTGGNLDMKVGTYRVCHFPCRG